MDNDMMSECKYTSPEICRAPLLLTLEKEGAGLTAAIDGAAVANFGFGSHFLRKYFYHPGGAQSMADIELEVTFPKTVLVREFHTAWNINSFEYTGESGLVFVLGSETRAVPRK